MLQYSEMTGWLALFAAIVHYRELDAENAIAAARGYYNFEFEKEIITKEKVKIIYSRGIDNLDKLTREIRLSRATIVKIYLLANIEEVADYGKKSKRTHRRANRANHTRR